MKKKLTIIIALVGSHTLFAQDCDLNKPSVSMNTLCANLQAQLMTADATLIAQDQIVFQPGFSINASNLMGHTFTAKIDKEFVIQPTNDGSTTFNPATIPSLDKNTCIPGTVGGSIDVSATGAATFQLPIQVSPGSHGVQPNLSIVYSSQGGNGLLGWGWNLAGLSSISRVNRNAYYDSSFDAIVLSDADGFSLDGTRLIKTAAGSFYPANNPYVKVVNANNTFTVTTQDGTVMEYGKEASSKVIINGHSVPISWAISRITDPNGNYIQFVYTGSSSTGEYLISEINYTGNSISGASPYNSVKFFYETRPDASTMFVAGGKLTQTMRLTSIKAYAEGVLSKNYTFTYINDQYSKLNTISLTADGAKYNPTYIQWKATPDFSTGTAVDAQLGSLRDYQLYSGDFNGDGLTDIVNQDQTVKIAKPDGSYTTYALTNPRVGGEYYLDIAYRSETPSIKDISISDWNNDGKDEILVHSTYYTYWYYYNPEQEMFREEDYVDAYTFNSSGFVMVNVSNINSLPVNYTNPVAKVLKHYFADINNDGVIDQITTSDKTLSSYTVYHENIPSITLIEDVKFVDFDGDGRVEILFLSADGKGTIWKYSDTNVSLVRQFANTTPLYFGKTENFFPGDFNGDGKTDYLSYYSSAWHLFFSTGTSFIAGSVPSTLTNNEPANTGKIQSGTTLYPATTVCVDDLNNDGESDIIYTLNNDVSILISNGNTFENKSTITIPSDNAIPSKIALKTFDFNTDGIKEIVYGNAGSANQPYMKIPFNNRLDQGLYVGAITDGANTTSTFTYSLFNDNRVFSSSFPKKPYPLMLVRGPMLVVSNLKTKIGSTTISDLSNTYMDGYTNLQGLGFLGFTTTISSDQVSGVSSKSSYEFTVPGIANIYIPWLKTQISAKGAAISTTTNTMELKTLDALRKGFLPIISNSSYDSEVTKNTTTITGFDDVLGRVTAQTTNKDGWIVTSSTQWAPTSGNISKPISVTTQHGSYSSTTTLGYESTSSMRVTSKTEQGVVTSYSNFDGYGNPQQITLSADGGTRSSSSLYETKGRFIASTTDVLGGITTYTYRAGDGAKLTETSATGTTTYVYSANAGKMVSTTSYPDGTISTKSFTWDAVDGFIGKESVTNGNVVTTYLNALGQKVKQTSYGYLGVTLTSNYAYNPQGQLITETLPGSISNAYSYDDYGRVKTVVGNNSNVSYSYGYLQSTTTSSVSGTESKTFDGMGNVLSVTKSKGGTVNYAYWDFGKVHTITTGSAVTTMTYYPVTLYQASLNDPDAGLTEYTYNGFGQLLTQKDAKNQIITCSYSPAGQLLSKTGTGINEAYTYFGTEDRKRLGLLKTVSRDGITESYNYDDFGRPTEASTTGSNNTFTTTYGYNAEKRLGTVTYPTGLSLIYDYDFVGNLTKISSTIPYDGGTRIEGDPTHVPLNNNTIIWEGKPKNDRQQWTNFEMSNGRIKTTWGYKESNYTLNSIKAIGGERFGSIQTLGFDFNNEGQLTKRTEGTLLEGDLLEENFHYDSRNRLDLATVTGQPGVNSSFEENGNVSSTSIAGSYTYDGVKPHAVGSVDGLTGTIETTSTFTPDNMISVIYNSTYKNLFTYGPSGNRFKVDRFEGNTPVSSKIYVGNNEFLYNGSGALVCKRTMVYAPTGICAVYQDSAGVESFHYIHTDYLGSWLKITDDNGMVENRYSYDAWGRPRNPNTWQLLPSTNNAQANQSALQPRFDRGYTGHEHMAGFALINMNGRLYDPYLQRFLSPDRYVSSPLNAQSYNRYTYCLNNPLMYTDPSGYFESPIYTWSYQDLTSENPRTCSGGQSLWRKSGWVVGVNSNMGGTDPGSKGYVWTGTGNNYIDKATGKVVTYDDVRTNYVIPYAGGYYEYREKGIDAAGYYLSKGTYQVWVSNSTGGHDAMDYVNAIVGATGTYFGYMGNMFHNKWYWVQKNGTLRSTQILNNTNKIYRTSYNLVKESFATVNIWSNRMATLGIVVTGIDVAVDGKVRPSHIVNFAAAGISYTGVGSIISGAYWLTDMGFEHFTGYSLGERLDQWLDPQHGGGSSW